VPYHKGQHFYSTRTEAGKQYPIHYRREDRPNAADEVILDLNELAIGCSYFDLGAFEVSDDGRLLAYSTDTRGFREYTLFIKNLTSGQLLADTRMHVDSIAWASDSKALLFTVENSAKRPWRICHVARTKRRFAHLRGIGREVSIVCKLDAKPRISAVEQPQPHCF
jgi:oligopeptidase B